MNIRIAMSGGIALAGLALLPMASPAAPAKTHTQTPPHKSVRAATATLYQCQTCHMKYTAAQAKKYHFKDPMDGGTLVPVTKSAGGRKL